MGPFASSLQKGRVYRDQGLSIAPVEAKGKVAAALMSFGSGLELGKTLKKKIQSPHLGKNVDGLCLLCGVFLPSIKDEGVLLRALPLVAVSTRSAWEGCKSVLAPISGCRECVRQQKLEFLHQVCDHVLPPRTRPRWKAELAARAQDPAAPGAHEAVTAASVEPCQGTLYTGKVSVSQFEGDALTMTRGKNKGQVL